MKKLVLVFASLLLLSCEQIKEGDIIKKEYEPAYAYMTAYSQNVNGTTVIVPVMNSVPEYFTITIEGYKDGERVTRTLHVSESEYLKYEIGQHLIVEKE
jgi:hypothetical protein